jgi:hypothetical protein
MRAIAGAITVLAAAILASTGGALWGISRPYQMENAGNTLIIAGLIAGVVGVGQLFCSSEKQPKT